MSENNIIIKTENIKKSYKMGAADVRVLKGVNLEVRRGEFLAVIGASGSGKSTLLHILGGLDKPDTGTVSFEGQDISSKNGRWMNKYRNKTVGFVFQFYHLLNELDVLENVILPAMASKSIFKWYLCRKKVQKRAAELLSLMGLESRVKHKPYQLSGGERQRVAIARALMNEPDLLLADEPTGNLDSVSGNGILKVFEELNKNGQTIVMVTHDDRIAQKAERTITLADGKVK